MKHGPGLSIKNLKNRYYFNYHNFSEVDLRPQNREFSLSKSATKTLEHDVNYVPFNSVCIAA